jgi:predicted metal-dependent hydrolase
MPRRRPVQFELPLGHRARDAVACARVVLDGRTVEYTVRRSARRRSIPLTLDERGLRVGAPWQAGEHAIVRQLHRHADWVLKKIEEWSRRRPAARRWQDGETVMLLGEPVRLSVLPKPCAPELRTGCLFVGCADPHHAAGLESEVTGWLRERALACFGERVAHFVPMLGVPTPHVRLSSARTRWGSCHPAGHILLNWRLIHFPLPLVDYVVVHELAHLRELNHSARFWRLVAQVVPDHAARRAELRTCSHQYLAL